MFRDKNINYIGKRVKVINSNKSRYRKSGVVDCYGTIVKDSSTFGVELDCLKNDASSIGIFWFAPYELNEIKEENGGYDMEGNFKIAVVNLYDDSYQKDYGFALYDKAVVGDFVVVNPRNVKCLGTIKEILTKEEYRGSTVTKEVIAVVNMDTYNNRVVDRERAAELEKEKKELQKEIDKKISKLRDLEFYERMSKELGYKDPEIAEMVNRLKALSK